MISFLVVGAHWRAHHRVFRYLGRVDRTFVRLNFAWLLIIVATPFLTEIIREGDLDVARFGLYALAQALLLIVFGSMQTVAGRRGLFVPGTPPEIVGHGWPHQVLGAGGFLVSIPLYLVLGAVGVRALGIGAEPAAAGLRGGAADPPALSRCVTPARSRRGTPPRPSRG